MVSAIGVVFAASASALQRVILHVIARGWILSVVKVGIALLLVTHHLVVLRQWLARVLHLTLLSELLQVWHLTGNLLGLVHLRLLRYAVGCHLAREILVLLRTQVLGVGVSLHF